MLPENTIKNTQSYHHGNVKEALVDAALKLIDWFKSGDWTLVAIDALVIVISVFVILEAASAIAQHRRTAGTAPRLDS